MKNLHIKQARFYWNCMSEMIVPTSLWEQTKHLKYQIFDAMSAEDLRELMIQ